MKITRVLMVGIFSSLALVADIASAKDGDVEARGPLVSLTSTSVTVRALTCTVSSSTEFKDENDKLISPSDFVVGDNVKLKCRGTAAKELERKRNDDNTGDGGDSDGSDDNGGDDKGGSGGSKKREIELDGRASAVTGVLTSATGKLEYKYKADEKGRVEIRFEGNVKIPVPSTIPPITDEAAASALGLVLTLTRDGAAFAQCDFAYDGLRTYKQNRSRAEFKVDIKQKKGSLQTKKGSCDTDLAQDGIQSGVPTPKKGDKFIVSEESAGSILEGTVR